jgi:hypothetical protein
MAMFQLDLFIFPGPIQALLRKGFIYPFIGQWLKSGAWNLVGCLDAVPPFQNIFGHLTRVFLRPKRIA